MSDASDIPPSRRPELIITPPDEDGQQVVKDPLTGKFFSLGPEEAFLLGCLDGRQTTADICAAFEKQFGQPLSAEDLEGFIELARGQGFLQTAGAPPPGPAAPPAPAPTANKASSAWSVENVLYF